MSSPPPPTDPLTPLVATYRGLLGDCRQLYARAATEAVQQSPERCGESPDAWLTRMDSLHAGLVIKVFYSVTAVDRIWTADKQTLAQALIEHVWRVRLEGEKLRDAMLQVGRSAADLSWYSLVRPFDRIPVLQEHVPELETIVMRLANLVAKSDGQISPSEAGRLVSIQEELHRHLKPLPLAAEDDCGEQAEQSVEQTLRAPVINKSAKSPTVGSTAQASPTPATGAAALAEAMAELDGLIGLDRIKQEVRTLANFLAVQKQRVDAGLPQTPVSLHLVFSGNPGTGKTTVARIIARVYAAMGLLKKGHLVETDRSGLVAKYAGQTGPRTHKKIDEALDGVLFIDEAYSLVSSEGDDVYGHEALQVLVKRVEDDRQRLVVILAGYQGPMEELIRSNPGLSSRFSTKLQFADYTPGQLGRILQLMADKNHYQIPRDTQARLLAGLAWLYNRRDEHFGNGRLVRNIFERAIRRLANRISGVVPLSKELLTVLEPEDIEFEGVPAQALACETLEQMQFTLTCPGCQISRRLSFKHLARRVQCKACTHSFSADWPEPDEDESPLN